MPKIIIDGQEIEVAEGTNLITAAAQAGIQIPHYCYHPGLKVDGNCRMCMVELPNPRGGGSFVPGIACATPVKDGLEIRTNTPLVQKLRRNVMEFLLLNHPIDCPICDQAGECRLQDYYMRYGLYDSRLDVEKVHKNKVVDIGPLVVLDQERCVLCSRCVRFTRDITKTDDLVITQRGDRARIEVFPGTQLDNNYSGNVVDICPVGALTSKDFRFKKRVWFLKPVRSVCTGCARGCNIWLDHADGAVWRYRPRENQEVNDWWMCDKGRLSYKSQNENRLLHPRVEGQPTDLMTALQTARAVIQQALSSGPRSVAAVGSPHATIEANFVLQRLARDVLGWAPLYGGEWTPDGEDDGFLLVSDRTPNRNGLQKLGINQDKSSTIDTLAGVKVLIVLENDLAGLGDPEVAATLQGVETIIALSGWENATVSRARIALPVASHGEQRGSFVNVDGRLQRVTPGPALKGEALPGWEMLGLLGGMFQPTFAYADIEAVWADIRQAHPEVGEVTFYGIGDQGRPWSAADTQADPRAQASAEGEGRGHTP